MIKLNKKIIEGAKLLDLFIWIVILLLLVYDILFNKIAIRKIWLIAVILAFISIALKIFFMVYDKKNKKIIVFDLNVKK